ncbi:MAG: hypothetical protein JWM68_2984 [Verrucomicrobiales bacterium]|nr:hypothetical protein [Verrucomicrobiales bacterium]
MKRLLCVMLLVLQMDFASAEGLQVIAGEPQFVFEGSKQSVPVTFRNNGDKEITAEIRILLVQESSATTMAIGESRPWKTLRVLAGQTVLETVSVDLPAIRATTSFQLRCLDVKSNELGKISLRVVPRDLLKQLSKLGGDKAIGVLDPADELKPLLKAAGVEFYDLETGSGFDGFEGKLAIVGPFVENKSLPENLRTRLVARAKRTPSAIILILPPSVQMDPFPPIYLVRESSSTIAVLQPKAVSSITNSPQAQFHLIRAAQMALDPDSLRLPRFEPHE